MSNKIVLSKKRIMLKYFGIILFLLKVLLNFFQKIVRVWGETPWFKSLK